MPVLREKDSENRATVHPLLREIGTITAKLLFFCALIFPAAVFSQSPDKELERRVRDALILNSKIFHAFLDVSAADGVVILGGRALTARELELARETALGVAGVRQVRLEAVVRPLGPEDAEALQKLRGVSPLPVPAKPVFPGRPKAKPSGPFSPSAPSPSEQMREQQNRVAEDARIRRDVEFAVQMEAGMPRVQSLHVTVLDGVVTLSGVVEDRRVRFQAETAARRVRGVKRVTNQLLVR